MQEFKRIQLNKYPYGVIKIYPYRLKERLIGAAIIAKDYDSIQYLMDNINAEVRSHYNYSNVENRVFYEDIGSLPEDLKSSDSTEIAEYGSDDSGVSLYLDPKEVNYEILIILLESAVKHLDLKAVDMIISNAKKSEDMYVSGCSYINGDLIACVCESYRWGGYKREKALDILKLLLKHKGASNISMEHLDPILYCMDDNELDELFSDIGMDVHIDCINKLDISIKNNIRKLENSRPIKEIDENSKTVMNLLLSRTFTDDLELEEIQAIYSNLYHLDPIAKEMIMCVAALINKGDDIKILISSEVGEDLYMGDKNIITINTKSKDDPIFNIDSIIIHEIGHFIYRSLQDSFLPYRFNKLQQITKIFDNYAETVGYNPRNPVIEVAHLIDNGDIEDIRKEIKILKEYELAARKPIDKAADLIAFNKFGYEGISPTKEYLDYFKNNSYINLFFISAVYKLADNTTSNNEENNSTEIQAYEIFDNILNIYLSDNGNVNDQELNPKKILDWSVNTFLPRFIEEQNLSEHEVHFLERIADYISRNENVYNSAFYNIFSDERYEELMVRAMELKAAHVEDEILDSFKDLENFHIKYTSPIACSLIHEGDVAYMPFDDDVSSVEYNCLSLV